MLFVTVTILFLDSYISKIIFYYIIWSNISEAFTDPEKFTYTFISSVFKWLIIQTATATLILVEGSLTKFNTHWTKFMADTTIFFLHLIANHSFVSFIILKYTKKTMVKQDNEVSELWTPNILSHALVLFHSEMLLTFTLKSFSMLSRQNICYDIVHRIITCSGSWVFSGIVLEINLNYVLKRVMWSKSVQKETIRPRKAVFWVKGP